MTKFIFAILLMTSLGFAQDQPYISVGKAKTRRTILAFPDVTGGRDVHDQAVSDLTFMSQFKFLDAHAYVDTDTNAVAPGTFKLAAWSGLGADFLIKAKLNKEVGRQNLEGYLYEISTGKTIFSKRYVSALGDSRNLAHTFANDIVHALTGAPGIFETKIVMSCERPAGRKELYLMDFDGSNVKQITNHRSIAFAPAWSPNGTKLAYSLYTKNRHNIKNIDLYEFDFTSSSYRMLSNRVGINSGAAYSPDGRRIALTMSFKGNPEIYIFDPADSTVERLTTSAGEDVDPSWSPDGKKITFVSSRSGQPMIYSMNSDGSHVTRLTYAGRYNATPSWSPRGDKILFSGWIDKSFDIFVMNQDGSNIERLTKGMGNNEDPSFSPDGNFVVFSSNRTGGQNVYVMDVDGQNVKRLTFGLGNCVAPKWSAN